MLGDAELPSFPGVVMTALEKARDTEAPLSDIGDIVSNDPGLSVRLLSAVNSAAFSLRHRVKSVHHAVSLLGRGEVESILIAVAATEALPCAPARGFDSRRFWLTAAQRATTGRALAERIAPSKRSETFTACLLQDMAIPVLAHHRGADYGPLLERWHGGTDELPDLERGLFDWDHAELASWMSEAWKFPEPLTRSIADHHAKKTDVHLPAVRLVSALREVNRSLGVERVVERAHVEYGIPKDETAELVRSSFEDAEDLARLFV